MKLLKRTMVISMLSLFLISNITYVTDIIYVDDPINGHH